MKTFCSFLTLLSLFGTVQADSKTTYKSVKNIPKEDLEKVISPELKGIVLVPSKNQLIREHELKNVSGVQIIDVPLPNPPCDDLIQPLSKFLNEPLTFKRLQEIKNKIYQFYEGSFHPLVAIEIPTQDITDGVLQVIVSESRLGKVHVEGNALWSNLDQIQNSFQINPGSYIDDRVVTSDLNFWNRSPFRRVSAIYEPGQTEGTTDLLLLVEDIRSYQFYVGTDDSGLKTTKEELIYAGMTLGNCFDLGHIFSYQYTTTDFHALQANTAQYIAPLPNFQLINLYGGFATVHPKNIYPAKTSSGYIGQASLRYIIPLTSTYNLNHEIAVGYDYKRMNSDLFFVPETAFAPFHQTVNLTQFVATYSGRYQLPKYTLTFALEAYTSPYSWLPQQSNADYSALSPGAKHKWIYGRAAFNYYQTLPAECYLACMMQAQLSSNTLLPSEQFGLGGYDTVRGYDARVLNQDNAILLSVEFHSPRWKIIQYVKPCTTLTDGLELLAFIDFSYGMNYTPVPGQKRHDYLAGIGPGLRYVVDPYLTSRLDWGIKLHKNNEIGKTLGFIHFAVVVSF